MIHAHQMVKAASKMSYWNPHVCINDTLNWSLVTPLHFLPFSVLFSHSKLSKITEVEQNCTEWHVTLSGKEMGFKYVFNIDSQKLRTRWETEIWQKLAVLFLPICHSLQRSEQPSEKETLHPKPHASSGNTLVSTFPQNKDIAKNFQAPPLKLWHDKYLKDLSDYY